MSNKIKLKNEQKNNRSPVLYSTKITLVKVEFAPITGHEGPQGE